MISRISFSKLTWDETKKLTWLGAFQFLLFFFLIPFRMLLILTLRNTENSWQEMQTPLETMAGQMGFGHIENTVFILGAGILCALVAFSYVHSQVKLDFYHSLALRRETLFAVKYLAGFLTFAIPYGICQLLGVAAGIPYGAVSGTLVLEAVVSSLQGILFFLVSYSSTLLAVMLTGKAVTSVFGVLVFGFYIPWLTLTEVGYRNVFFPTDLVGRLGKLGGVIPIEYSSPWMICGSMNVKRGEDLRQGLTGCWPPFEDLCQLLVLIVILTGISLLLYRIRKTESSGSALAFSKTEGAVKILLAVPGALLAGLAGYSILMSEVWGAVFAAAAGFLICIIMEFIYRWDIRQSLMHKGQICLTVVVSLCLFLGGRYDATGYNTYLPAEDEVEAMAVCDPWTDYSYEISPGNWIASGEMGMKDRLDYLETQEIAPIYRIAQSGAENAKEKDMGYGNGDEERVAVSLKYQLKNGESVYRFYYVDSSVYYESMEELWQNEDFREKYCPVLSMEPGQIQELTCQWYAEGRWRQAGETAESETESALSAEEEYYMEDGVEFHVIPAQEIPQFLEAYKKDLSQLSFREVFSIYEAYTYMESGQLIVELREGLLDYYPLNFGFKNTIEFLKDL